MAPTLCDTDAKPGDLIEISRGIYKHWAVYIGGNEVVHLIPPNTGTDLGAFAELFKMLDSSTVQVRRQKIWDVVGFSSYKVNNLLDNEYRPRDPRVIVRDACWLVGRELPYNVVTNNCEHFVTELRYGRSESRQVQTAAVIAGVATVGVAFTALGAALFSSLLKDDSKRNNHK